MSTQAASSFSCSVLSSSLLSVSSALISFSCISGLLLATSHSTGTAFLLPSLCGNSVLSVVNILPLFPEFSLATRHSSLATNSNHSRTYEPFSRKSNYSRTYAKTGGRGYPPQDALADNSFVFFHYVNYMLKYMNTYIVGAPTFSCATKESPGKNACATKGNALNCKLSTVDCRPSIRERAIGVSATQALLDYPFGAFPLINDTEPNQPLLQPSGIGTTRDP